MKTSDINHLRRLLAWVRADIGQTPQEIEAMVADIAAKLGNPDIDDNARARLVNTHDRARAVPKYVREAVKALEKHVGYSGQTIEDTAWSENTFSKEGLNLAAPALGNNGFLRLVVGGAPSFVFNPVESFSSEPDFCLELMQKMAQRTLSAEEYALAIQVANEAIAGADQPSLLLLISAWRSVPILADFAEALGNAALPGDRGA